jgi:hypothetical protein
MTPAQRVTELACLKSDCNRGVVSCTTSKYVQTPAVPPSTPPVTTISYATMAGTTPSVVSYTTMAAGATPSIVSVLSPPSIAPTATPPSAPPCPGGSLIRQILSANTTPAVPPTAPPTPSGLVQINGCY